MGVEVVESQSVEEQIDGVLLRDFIIKELEKASESIDLNDSLSAQKHIKVASEGYYNLKFAVLLTAALAVIVTWLTLNAAFTPGLTSLVNGLLWFLLQAANLAILLIVGACVLVIIPMAIYREGHAAAVRDMVKRKREESGE